MSARFELGVYTPSGGVVSVADYLAGRGRGEHTWLPDPNDSTLFLQVDDREWMADSWNLGALERIVPQLEAAHGRLAFRRPAIIRSAVEDYAEVPYLLLEPTGADSVAISLFFVEDENARARYPAEEASPALDPAGDSEALYEHVAEHRDELLDSVPDDLKETSPVGVLFPLRQLDESLEREAKLGRELLELLPRVVR